MRLTVCLALLMACRHTAPAVTVVEAPMAVVELARAREVPARVRARFGVKLRSPRNGIAGSTSGALVLDRPGRGRFDLLTPLGGSALTVASDAGAALVIIAREDKAFQSPEAEAILREATGGLLGLDDLWALVQGDLPFDAAPARSVKALDDGTVRAVLRGKGGAVAEVVLDPAGNTLRQLTVRDDAGAEVVSATYDGWSPLGEGGPLLPDRVTLFIASADLTIDLKIRSWTLLDEAPAGAFAPPVPKGFALLPMEEVLSGLAAGVPLTAESD